MLANKIRHYSSEILGLKAFTLEEPVAAAEAPAAVPAAIAKQAVAK